MPDGVEPPADAFGQAKRCLEIVSTALEQVGSSIRDVVRTRCYLVAAEDWREVGRAHGEVFGDASSDVRPASSMIVVTGFIDPRWRVEIEADAILDEELGAGAARPAPVASYRGSIRMDSTIWISSARSCAEVPRPSAASNKTGTPSTLTIQSRSC